MNGDIGITIGLLIFSAVLTFLIRIGFRLHYRRSSGGDVWYHLHAAEEIRKNRFRMPDRLSRYSLDTAFDTPSLTYGMLALLPKRLRERDYLFGPLADSILSSVVFLFSLWIAHNPYLAFLSAFAFSMTPILLKADARVFFFSPRPWAELFASVSLLFGVLFYLEHTIVLGFLAVLFGSFVFLTSKFGAQAILLLSIGLSVALLALEFLLVLFLAFLLAILVSKGYYLRVLRGHMKHSNFYRTTIVRRHTGTMQISGWKDIISALRGKERMVKVLARNPIVISLAFMPLLPLMWVAYILDSGPFLLNSMLMVLFAWATVAFIIAVLISTRQLRFLGEAERYQGYATLPLCVLVPIVIGMANSAVLWVLLAIVLLYSALLLRVNYQIASRYFGVSRSDERFSEEFFRWLTSVPEETILCIPFNIAPEITYKTIHKTVYWGGNLPARNLTTEDFKELFDEFPYPRDDLARLCRKFGATLVVFSKRFMGTLSSSDYDLTRFREVFENGGFDAYKSEVELDE